MNDEVRPLYDSGQPAPSRSSKKKSSRNEIDEDIRMRNEEAQARERATAEVPWVREIPLHSKWDEHKDRVQNYMRAARNKAGREDDFPRPGLRRADSETSRSNDSPTSGPKLPLERSSYPEPSSTDVPESIERHTGHSNYPYTLLNNNNHEIRILKLSSALLKHEGEEEVRLEGTLEHVSLIDTEPYIALSYCWGNPASHKSLRLYSSNRIWGPLTMHNVAIADNLDSALQALWKRRGVKETLRVWIDAICINQGDLYERSQQVHMMRQIYSRAEMVLAWVGPTAGTALTPTDLNHLSNWTAPSGEPWKGWETLETFFNEEYWKRVWIIQEITVASKVTVLYGDLEFSWDNLVAALESLVKRIAQGHVKNIFDGDGIAASHLLKFREHWMDSSKPISLLQAMTWTLHTRATDPRDKIFALLGLCHDGSRIVPLPNYKQSLESIISEMSRLSFSRIRSLDLMCIRGTGTVPIEYTQLPTWAPRWPTLWSSKSMTLHELLILRSPKSFKFDPVLTTSTNSVLKVEAWKVGWIKGLSSALESGSRHAQTTQSHQDQKLWIFRAETRLGWDRPLAPARVDILSQRRKIIWRTLTMNCAGLGIDPNIIDECFDSIWTPLGRGSIYSTQIIDWIDKNAFFPIGSWNLREWSQLRELAPSADRSTDKTIPREAYHARVWKSTNQALEQVLRSGMRLAELNITTEEVPYPTAGLVNPHTEVGDEVYLIKGCNIPVVMRPAGPVDQNRYSLIGGMWLHDEVVQKITLEVTVHTSPEDLFRVLDLV